MGELVGMVRDLGFPIFVSVFMLVKNSKDNENHTKALTELKTAIEKLISCTPSNNRGL